MWDKLAENSFIMPKAAWNKLVISHYFTSEHFYVKYENSNFNFFYVKAYFYNVFSAFRFYPQGQ